MKIPLEVCLRGVEYCTDRVTNLMNSVFDCKHVQVNGTAISIRRRYNFYKKLPFSPFSKANYNPSFGQNTRIQMKLFATNKHNRLRRILKKTTDREAGETRGDLYRDS